MKKIVVMFLTLIMMLSIASSASATLHLNDPTTFEFSAQCKEENTYTDEKKEIQKYTSAVHAIYLKHWVSGASAEYTNHFRGRKMATFGGPRTNCGAKWCTINLNVPIQSNNIVYGGIYSVSGRGNTNYYNYDGVSRITLHGNMYINPTED